MPEALVTLLSRFSLLFTVALSGAGWAPSQTVAYDSEGQITVASLADESDWSFAKVNATGGGFSVVVAKYNGLTRPSHIAVSAEGESAFIQLDMVGEGIPGEDGPLSALQRLEL